MNKFLKNAFAFLAPPLVVAAVVAAVSMATVRATYLRKIALPEDVRFVVIGDSEPACAIDPAAFTGMVNQASAALTLDQALYKARDLLDVSAGRDFAFVLAVSPRRMSMELAPMASGDYETRYAMLNYLHATDGRRAIGEPVRIFRDRVVPDAFHQLTGYRFKKNSRKRGGMNMEVPWGGFTPCPGAHYLDDPAKAEAETADYFEKLSAAYSGDPEFLRGAGLVGEIVDLVRASGRRVVLLTTPWHRSLRERIPPETLGRFRQSMRRLAERHGTEWIDDLELELSDECFLNQNHLNAMGARVYSEDLARRMKVE